MSTQRLSTQVAHAFRARYGIKPRRAKLYTYDRNLVHLTLTTEQAQRFPRFDGEHNRALGRSLFNVLPHLTVIYVKPEAYVSA